MKGTCGILVYKLSQNACSLPISNPFVFQVRHAVLEDGSLHRFLICFRHLHVCYAPINLHRC